MRITNKTHWRTDHLRAILQRAAEQELEPATRRDLHVTVVYATRGRVSGCAYIGGRTAIIRLGSTAQTPRATAAYWIAELHRDINEPHGHGPAYAAFAARRAVHLTEQPDTGADFRQRLAHLACHEFAHVRGMRHRQMPAYYTWRGDWRPRVAWAADMPLERQTPKPTIRPTLDTRLAHIATRRRLAETRLKRAQTILRKWQRRERDCQRRLAALRTDTARPTGDATTQGRKDA